MEKIHYSHCPVCRSEKIREEIQVKDYTVSGELFTIMSCENCTLRFTQDIPAEDAIAPYYKAESYVSHTDTKKGLINKLYHWVRRRTLARKRKLVRRYTGLEKGSLLDVGCGTGAFVYEMQRHGWQAAGIEPDSGAREAAKKLYGLTVNTPDEFWQLPPASADAISLWHVLEHVHALHAYIEQLKKIIRPGGKIIIAVPNHTAKDAAVYGFHWAAYDVPRHLYHFSPGSIEVLMQQHGLRVAAYRPMWYDSFYISLLSSKYKTGKMKWLPALWNGLRSNLAAWGNTKKCSSVIYIISK